MEGKKTAVLVDGNLFFLEDIKRASKSSKLALSIEFNDGYSIDVAFENTPQMDEFLKETHNRLNGVNPSVIAQDINPVFDRFNAIIRKVTEE